MKPWLKAASALFGVGAVALTLTAASRASKSSAAPRHSRIALIGDSYAVGLGPELAKLLPDFKAEGHVGTNTSQWAHHDRACGTCGDWLTAFAPTLVLVSLGVNDDGSPHIENYQAIVRALHGIGARVVWIEPPANVTVNVAAVRRIIASLGVETVPATQTALSSDGVHPQSYAPWAREVAGHVVA